MCGIAGIVELNNHKAVDEFLLKKMNSFNRFRGPDDGGIWIQNNIGLAHRRLSIVDLSPNGNQPMTIQGGTLAITYNGEIYNFQDLRKELVSNGFSFFSNTDTEVILNGYLHWGIHRLLQQLDGMFAFTIVDLKTQKIYICRDRFGKKPLYYFKNAQKISFASDIRSISSVETDLTLDYRTIDYYLSELSAPQPYTIWSEIQQVKSGHYLSVDLSTKSITEDSYWKLESKPDYSMSVTEAIETVEQKLKIAVQKRTMGDEKIAAFLSGGVDSGLVVALMASASSEKLSTYTIGLEYAPLDEQKYAKQLSEKYSTDHHTYIVKADIIELLPELIEGFGEPFADSSNIPSYYITKEMHKHCKVAFSGDGGDEIFGGYTEYSWAYNTDEYLKKYPGKHYRELVSLLSKAYSRVNKSHENLGHLESYLKMSGGSKLFRNMGFSQEEKNNLYSSEMSEKVSGSTTEYLNAIWENNKQDTILDTLFLSSVHTRLLNDYLVKVDRSSMMNSLEIRCPFLDKDLAEFAFTIPGNLKLQNGTTKYILKELAKKYVDKDIVSREKMGFGVPIAQWIRTELKDFIRNVLLSETLKKRNLFSMEYISLMLDQHYSGKYDHSDKIWAIMCLEIWFQKFYDK